MIGRVRPTTGLISHRQRYIFGGLFDDPREPPMGGPISFPNEENPVKKSALVFTLLAAVLMIALAGCGDKKETAQSAPSSGTQAAAPAANPNMWRGTVVETMNSGGYTYVYLDTGSEKIWAAGPKAEFAVGQEIVTDKGMATGIFMAKNKFTVGRVVGPAVCQNFGV